MPKFNWVITCQRALIDQTNNLSIIQVLEELSIPAPPENSPVAKGALIPIPLTVVTSWQRADNNKGEKTQVRIRMSSPTGKIFGRAEFLLDLTTARRARHLAELGGLPYHGAGVYSIKIDVEVGKRWRNVGETDFLLRHNMAVSAETMKH